jgi:hypothetical protein
VISSFADSCQYPPETSADRLFSPSLRNSVCCEYLIFLPCRLCPPPKYHSMLWLPLFGIEEQHVPEKGVEQALTLEFYRQLPALHTKLPALQEFQRGRIEVTGVQQQKTLVIRRHAEESAVLCLFKFNNMQDEVALSQSQGNCEKTLDSSAQHWRGPGDAAVVTIVVAKAGAESSININTFSVLVLVYAGNNIGGLNGAT